MGTQDKDLLDRGTIGAYTINLVGTSVVQEERKPNEELADAHRHRTKNEQMIRSLNVGVVENTNSRLEPITALGL